MFVEADGGWVFHKDDGVLVIGPRLSLVFDRAAGILHALGDGAYLRGWSARTAAMLIETRGVEAANGAIDNWVQLDMDFTRPVAIVSNRRSGKQPRPWMVCRRHPAASPNAW